MDWFKAVPHRVQSGVFWFSLDQAFSHGFPIEFDVMGIVRESVEDGIGEGWIFHSPSASV